MVANRIISQKLITDAFDILELNIIDFNRLNGYWLNPSEAVKCIFSWLDGMAVATVYKANDFEDAPKRDDWPGWKHIGGHERMGERFWNWFLWKNPGCKLQFDDEPDFYGTMPDGVRLTGDIGRVSASSFVVAQRNLRKNDIWVSVLGDGETHVIIEILANREPVEAKEPVAPLSQQYRAVKVKKPGVYREVIQYGFMM